MNQAEREQSRRGLISWFARNSVAANLLMIIILFTGLGSAYTIKRSMMPEVMPNLITIQVPYPGAAPEEVELGVILKIEEALKDIESIDHIHATARESLAVINLDILDDYDMATVLDEVQSAVEGISNLPEQSERPVIQQAQFRNMAISVQLAGEIDERSMKELITEVRQELQRLPEVGYIEVYGDRPYEIAIELSESTLEKYDLSLAQVASAVSNNSLDLPGGAIRSVNGEIMLRTRGQAYQQQDFEAITLITYPDGTRLQLGDIATVRDDFVESSGFSIFNGRYSVGLTVFTSGEQDVIEAAEATKRYVEKKRQSLPEEISITAWSDITYYLESRIDMMLGNLALGAALVFLVLSLFLEIRLAFWVMVGLPICFLGALALMPIPLVDVHLNMISLIGFILVLGIVVDDAIIIGESVHASSERWGHSVDSVVAGAQRVAMPATFGVLTTIVAFTPMLFVEGVFAPMPWSMGWVVILCLAFSLVESKWILPAHLVHSPPSQSRFLEVLNRPQRWCNTQLKGFIQHRYIPFLKTCIRNRYLTVGVFLSALILAVGLVGGGVVRYVMMPDMPSDFIQAEVQLLEGTPESELLRAQAQVRAGLEQLEAETSDQLIKHYASWGYELTTSFMVELTKNENRSIDSFEISRRWREKVGDIPGAKVFSITSAEDMGGAALELRLSGPDFDKISEAAAELEDYLSGFDGLFDIRNTAEASRDEILIDLKPAAHLLGLSLADVGSQVRQAFYGAEAQRLQRGAHEPKVMVRLPAADRKTLADLENMQIRAPNGEWVPLSVVASLRSEAGMNRITRVDGERAITISSQADKSLVEPDILVADILQNRLPEMQQRYPGLKMTMGGQNEQSQRMLSSMFAGLVLSLFVIYALLAIPLQSYIQPLIVMGVIPFGMIGAICGHWIMDRPLDMMSLMGVIALSGVVVNDSLIMVDFINKARARGEALSEAVIGAGSQRFRAILLTSMTTFLGLSPMLAETSLQAQMGIPLAMSLGFGILFATVITLLLVPCLYVIRADFIEDRHIATAHTEATAS